jgi:hypothetical protein
MFKMTYNEAMIIQRAQMAYYRQRIGRAGVKAIHKGTTCPEDLNPNELLNVSYINELVPRGADFENLFRWFGPSDPTNYDMHNAIRRGIL